MHLADEKFSDLQLEPEPSIQPDPAMVEQPTRPIALNTISAIKRSRGRAMRLEDVIHYTPVQVFIDSGADQSRYLVL